MRSRKKMALYEVIGKSRPKSLSTQQLEPLHSERCCQNEAGLDVESLPESGYIDEVRWSKKPKMVQFNAGRIEISISYQLAIALILGVVLLLLVVFRLGQLTLSDSSKAVNSTVEITKKLPETIINKPVETRVQLPDLAAIAPLPKKVEVKAAVSGNVLVDASKSNRIVIQTYHNRVHLEPVKKYFAGFGIKTEIKKIDNWYYLITGDKYDNPQRAGTDGYRARQEIIKIGANYKAPQGYETFGSKPFSDAYGKKFDD
ncbi:MAG: hypothetical protein KAQ89_02105 [Planctomycetes bacterium]|nr:hypothetical protein [Planctomycetota bacterium]